MLFVVALTRIDERVGSYFRQPQCFVQFPVGEQPGIASDLAAHETQLQPPVKTDTQIVLFGVTHRVSLSPWHVDCPNPCFPRIWRKSRAKAREVTWEMRV